MGAVCIGGVRHRIDGLEIGQHHIQAFKAVRHRIDGLEKQSPQVQTAPTVRHRIDGLEIKIKL